MLKKLLLLLFGIFALSQISGLNTANAQDGFYTDAQTLVNGGGLLGIQPVYFTESEEAMLMFRGAYGLNSTVTLHGKLGVLEDETYGGGHLEIGLASEPSSSLSLALLTGVHIWDEPGLKAALKVSKRWDQISLFSGLSYEPIFYDNNTLNPLLVPVGIDVHLNGSANLVLEADIAGNDDGEFLQAITGGVYFYL
jgi:hypothetical protein